MSGRRMKALRRAARAAADSEQNKQMVKRHRQTFPIVAPETGFADTVFWPKGSYRQIYQESKRG